MRGTVSIVTRCVPCVTIALGASALAFLAYGSSAALPDRIVANVSIGGVGVGGMDPVEAFDAVSSYAARRLDETVALTSGERRFPITFRELGADADVRGAVDHALRLGRAGSLTSCWRQTVDTVRTPARIELPLRFRRPTMEAALRGLAESIRRQPTNASAEIVAGNVKVKPHVVGVEPDVPATSDAILEAARRDGPLEVVFVTRETVPEVLASDLEGLVVLGSFSTQFSTGQANRAGNIRLGSSYLDGAVIPPGAVFSVNQRMGPRTIEKGFLVAPVYSGERTIMGVGGGICQIATTLYNAALASGMTIVERHQHSKPVHYVPWGRDATIDYGAADLRFQNPSDGPAIVRVRVDGGTITAALLGRSGSPSGSPESDAAR